MTEEEKKIKQQQIEDMINETEGENLEEIFNDSNDNEENNQENENEDINIGGVLNTDLILSMMGSIVQGAYAGLPAEEANASYVKWYTLNKTIFTGLNMDSRLKNIKLVNVPDPIAYLIAGGAVIASTIIFVNAGKKKQLEKVQQKQQDNKWKKEEVHKVQQQNEYEEMNGEELNMKEGEEF